MRITEVKTCVLGTPWRNLTFVELATDDGLTGLGEVRLNNRTDALLGYLEGASQRFILGSDPFNIEDLVLRMSRNDFGRVGEIVASAISIVEIACWDLVGKATGQPIYRLLGGACRDRVKAYANGWYTVERSPAAFAAAARRVIERGYQAMKLDPFGSGYYELTRDERLLSIALVEAVRATVGPEVEILIEMHGRFSPAQAIALAAELERFEPSWVEEPVPPDNLEALEKAARGIRVPVAAGERAHTRHEFRRLLELQAVDILQPDITQMGGLLEAKKVAAMADACYVLVAPHNVGGPVSTTAALHLAACTPNVKILEHFNDFDEPYVKQAATGCPEVVDGWFPLPQGPGLGVELQREVVEAHPLRPVHFDLYRDDWHRRGR